MKATIKQTKKAIYSESKVEKFSILNLRDNPRQDFLDSFICLYNKTFTNPLERESPSEWPNRMWQDAKAPQPSTHLLVSLASSGPDEQCVVGGLIFEHYRASHCGLLTYLVVEQDWRQKGIAKALVDKALAILIQKERDSGGQLKAVFCETENPHFVPDEQSVMPTCERLNILLNLGARLIDLQKYIQPPLVGGEGPCEHLLLMAFDRPGCLEADIDNEPAKIIGGEVIYDFLNEFYRAQGVDCPEEDMSFREMAPHLHNDLRLHDPREKPILNLENVAVCLHYVQPYPESPPKQALSYPGCHVFQSMELDLMSYGYQVRKLLGSQCEHKRQIPIEIEFPERVDYLTEGRHMLLLPARRNCRARAMVSSTLFLISGIRVWHVVLVPDNDEIFTEFDIIKLIHLYDGRTENTNLGSKVKFLLRSKELKEIKVTADGLLEAMLSNLPNCLKNCKPTGGTVQIATGKASTLVGSNLVDMMDLIATVKSIRTASSQQMYNHFVSMISNGTPQGKALLALCGIIGGIFDFAEVDAEEVLDTLEPTFTSSDSLIRIHRCTMVSIAEHDRAMAEVVDTIGISPYLLIPHSALLHNEALIEDSEVALSKVTNTRRIAKLEAACQRMERNLNRFYLPNVFNYITEKTLFARGSEERGTNERLAAIRAKLQEVDSQVKVAWERRHDHRQKHISALLSVFTVIGLRNVLFDIMKGTAFEPYSWWVLCGLAGVMVLLYVLWAAKRK